MKDRESYTLLNNAQIVRKDHPIIALRGGLDLLEASILRASGMARDQGYSLMSEDLNGIFGVCAQLMRSEVKNEQVGALDMLGMSADMLREVSHHPRKYFGIDLAAPAPDMGAMMLEANLCRALARRIEIDAVRAFGDNPGRQDLIAAYNRVSSALYIVMCRLSAGYYHPGDL